MAMYVVRFVLFLISLGPSSAKASKTSVTPARPAAQTAAQKRSDPAAVPPQPEEAKDAVTREEIQRLFGRALRVR
ncbi:hypothetical protein [Sulfitobacter sp. S190]|uniref:hypothetical protein n=1 Tax=Sulfitobacter sp. S190 TaxID=2867022 RepID=UPI0021A8504B|nr:hypothetical protein [Sulfitobacter sp. S190]UWR23553.1 hypothetical protein K3756_06135 [Sulfitobacter sp. S190]